MFLDFSWLPPEINSALIYAGAGSGPLHVAAAAWDGLAQDLQSSASSFESVIAGLSSGPWSGPASASMAAASVPYVGWLSAAAGQAALAGDQARAAATAFEAALSATVHPLAVTSNRTTLTSLVATNFLGQNTPAIAANESDYSEMWAQDVGAMLGYHAGATSAASTLAPFSIPPLNLAGLGSQVSGWASQLVGGVTSAVAPLTTGLQSGLSAIPGALSSVQAAASALPISSLTQVAQVGMLPASMLMSPMMSLAQGAGGGTAGLAAANTALVDAPKLAGGAVPEMKGLGAGGGIGAGMAGGLGNARLVGALSVPPTWQGSMPGKMGSAAMAGLGPGGAMNAAEMAAVAGGGAPAGGGMPMMPMPMGGGAGAGMPGAGMMGRGGASPHVIQNRPAVVPRDGVG
jgi:PPE-repeat protein